MILLCLILLSLILLSLIQLRSEHTTLILRSTYAFSRPVYTPPSPARTDFARIAMDWEEHTALPPLLNLLALPWITFTWLARTGRRAVRTIGTVSRRVQVSAAAGSPLESAGSCRSSRPFEKLLDSDGPGVTWAAPVRGASNDDEATRQHATTRQHAAATTLQHAASRRSMTRQYTRTYLAKHQAGNDPLEETGDARPPSLAERSMTTKFASHGFKSVEFDMPTMEEFKDAIASELEEQMGAWETTEQLIDSAVTSLMAEMHEVKAIAMASAAALHVEPAKPVRKQASAALTSLNALKAGPNALGAFGEGLTKMSSLGEAGSLPWKLAERVQAGVQTGVQNLRRGTVEPSNRSRHDGSATVPTPAASTPRTAAAATSGLVA